MLRRLTRVPMFRSGGGPVTPGLVDMEHKDLTSRELKNEMQTKSIQMEKSWFFTILSHPTL